MRTLNAFVRLGWRVRVPLVLIWIGWLLVGMPTIQLFDNPVSPLDVTAREQLTPASWVALWRIVLAVPATFAVIGTWLTTELRMGLYSWTFPRLREMFTTDLALLAVVSSLPAAMLIAHMGLPNAGIAAFALGLFAFGAVCRIVDALARHLPSLLAVGTATLFAVRAGAVGDVAVAHPWLFAVAGACAAASCLALEYLPATGRLRVAQKDNPWRLPRFRTKGRMGDEPTGNVWRHGLWNESIIGWTRAATYEASLGSRFYALFSVALPLLLFGWFFRLSRAGGAEQSFIVSQVFFLSSLDFLWRPPILGRSLLYPITRRKQAIVAFWGTILGTVRVAVIALIGFGLAATMHRWIPGLAITWVGFRIALRMMPLLLVWTPAAVWAHVRYARRRGRNPMPTVPFITSLVFIGAALPLFAAIMEFSDTGSMADGPVSVILWIALGLAVQLLYWSLLKRHFNAADLVWTTGDI